MKDISDSALSNKKVVNDIAGLYLVISSNDATLPYRAIGRTIMADDVVLRDSEGYKHIRLGVRFVGSDEVEFIKNLANPDDLETIKSVISNLSSEVQLLAQLITNLDTTGTVTDNLIVRLIFQALFGSN